MHKEGKIVLKGVINVKDRLWDILIQSALPHNNYIIPKINLCICKRKNKGSNKNMMIKYKPLKKLNKLKKVIFKENMDDLIENNILDGKIKKNYKANTFIYLYSKITSECFAFLQVP